MLVLAGCQNLTHHDLGPVTAAPASAPGAATNGSWPMLSTFDLNVTADNAGSTVDPSNDNLDGCGGSSSSASLSKQSGSWNGSSFCRVSYSVGTNAGCGYECASLGFDMVSQPSLTAVA